MLWLCEYRTETTCQHVSPLIKYTERVITLQREEVQHFLILLFHQVGAGEDAAVHLRYPSLPLPLARPPWMALLTSCRSRTRGYTAIRHRYFCLFLQAFFLRFHISKNLSWGKFSATELSQQFSVKGEVSLILSFPPQQLCPPESTPRAFTTLSSLASAGAGALRSRRRTFSSTGLPICSTHDNPTPWRGKHKAPYTEALNPTLMQ